MPEAGVKVGRSAAEAELEHLLDTLDAANASPTARQRRTYERLRYRRTPITVHLTHPGGSNATVNVLARNLSAGGMCFLNAGFVHPGTKCTAHLTNVMGQTIAIGGTVRWCSHVSGRLHQLGVKFNNPIDPRQFLDATKARATAKETGDTKTLAAGRVLYIDDEGLDRELMRMALQDSPMQVDAVDNPEQALEAIGQQVYDVIITDLHLGKATGVDAIRAIRDSGYRGPILLLTLDSDSELARTAVDAGADEVIGKPYDAGSLLLRLNHHIRARNTPTGSEPIYSQLEDVLSITEPVEKFIDVSRGKVVDLERSITSDDLETARMVCKAFKATGSGFGFPVVTECAAAALRAIDATMSVKESRDELRRLAQVINRLAVRKKAQTDDDE